jgi:hypothetical protein
LIYVDNYSVMLIIWNILQVINRRLLASDHYQVLSSAKPTIIMKRIFLTLSLTITCLSLFAQSFEGKIIFQNSYKSKNAALSDEKLSAMMGNVGNYYMKAGEYKSEANGTFMLWQLYKNSENKLYSKIANSEAVFWNDGAVNNDQVLKIELHKKAAIILGYNCDELILTCKSGIQKYYFSSKLPVDASLYSKHQFGNWFTYVQNAKAIPLKMIIDNAQLTMESTATSVKSMKLDQALFSLPANAKTIKSPY